MTKKPKGLLLADDLRFFSGISTMSRELVLGTVHRYDWVQIAGAVKHPDAGKIIDISKSVQDETKVTDAFVRLYPTNDYGNAEMLFTVINSEKPDFILHFTDPRYWGWLYAIENQIRSKIPLTYLTIWDDLPYPMWNKPFYQSCDSLLCISKQTENIVEHVLGKDNCIKI